MNKEEINEFIALTEEKFVKLRKFIDKLYNFSYENKNKAISNKKKVLDEIIMGMDSLNALGNSYFSGVRELKNILDNEDKKNKLKLILLLLCHLAGYALLMVSPELALICCLITGFSLSKTANDAHENDELTKKLINQLGIFNREFSDLSITLNNVHTFILSSYDEIEDIKIVDKNKSMVSSNDIDDLLESIYPKEEEQNLILKKKITNKKRKSNH